jgi:hypothetical protein
MKRLVSLAALALLLWSCDTFTAGPSQPPPPPPPPPPQEITPVCQKINSMPVKTRQQFEDYYGTMITSDTASLRTPGGDYRWGIKNVSPLSMAYFASYVKPAGKYRYFRTRIYIDGGVRAPMIFLVRNGDRNGEVLKSVTINPGQTKEIVVEIPGVKKMYIGSELRINHDKAEKIVLGEPEFYNCK